MTATLEISVAENALRSIRSAQAKIAEQFDLDPVTNTFGKSLPVWVSELSASLHAAHDNLVNAIDHDLSRDAGWWERI